MPGCGYLRTTITHAPSGNPLPLPAGPVVQGSLSVTGTAIGAVPARFVGLSYEKLAMSYGYFHAQTTTSLRYFAASVPAFCALEAAPSIACCGPQAARALTQQISSTNVKDLAGFLQATGLALPLRHQPRYFDALFSSGRSCSFAASVLGETSWVSRSGTSLTNMA